MNTSRRGASTVQTFAILLALVVIGGVAWYFTSDVFRTKVDSTARELTYWTPDNIAKDPVNYLNFVEKKTKDALTDLKANKISIAQSRGKLQEMQNVSNRKITNGGKALDELKPAYTQAEATNAFPVQWNGRAFNREEIRAQIVSFHRQIERENGLLTKVTNGLKQLDVQDAKVREAEASAQEQLAEVSTNRELLKVQALTDDLQARLVSMRGALQATVATVSESSSIVTLDQLEAETAATVDDAEFQAIMDQK